MLVRGIIIDDGVDRLSSRYLGLDGVEEADKLLMPVARRLTVYSVDLILLRSDMHEVWRGNAAPADAAALTATATGH